MSVELHESVQHGVQISTITIDNPPVNVLDIDHCRELSSVMHQIRADDRSRVVIFRGAGKDFSAGVDIKQHTPEQMPTLLPVFHEVFHSMLGLRAVTIAAVHGNCLGGGAELAFACDRVVATNDAKIGFPEIQVGCYPPVALSLLPYRAGPGKAVEMIIGGQEISVDRFVEWGMIDRVVKPGKLDKGITKEVALYEGRSPAVMGMVAGLLHVEAQRRWGERIALYEKEYLDVLLAHPDASEGIAAFAEKRDPVWQSPDEEVRPEDSLL